MKVRFTAVCLAATATLFAVIEPSPAQASGAGNVEFSVNGTLSPFPSSNGSAGFSGQGTGTGHAVATDGSNYDATFTILGMPVSGLVNYSEPIFPVCPLLGSAVPQNGHITMGGPNLPSVTGVVYRAGATLTGTVTGLVNDFTFSYERVGATTALVLSGYTTVYFYIPGTGYGSFTSSFVGTGVGVFQVDPVQAELNCINNGGPPMPFTMSGDAAVAG